ncbi:DUF4249 family protein [Hymenobacter psychrophilus]|uniref:DUF4249 domain-containing protein n=1 Tax=Hymenobacter psychrophilus TaxID=651662 RepID=A0A1H3AVJ0_9BACT|nr:DUF4249 family protein [Hymenobacter psychrophilus]SDX33726.1 protein of unknown function [Hymenobacter psychrophilus]
MDKLRLLLVVSLSLGLAGCETVVDVDTPPHTPRLALSYTLSNTPPELPSNTSNRSFFGQRQLYVSSSQGVLETKELAGRGDATVQLFDESGRLVEQFRSKAQQGYFGSGGGPRDSIYGDYVPTRGFVGVPGRRYTLRASAPGVAAVEATIALPAVPTVESAGYAAKPRDPNNGGYGYDYSGRLTVAVADNPATTDYYLAYARVLDKQGNYWGAVSRDYSAPGADGPDINLSRFQLSDPSSFYSQYPYSDVGSNGPLLSFGTDVRLYFQGGYGSGGSVPEPGYIEVVVSSITPDTYQFYQSVLRFYDTDGNPFAEPAPLHSNLRGGYGLFGGATDAVYRIPLL